MANVEQKNLDYEELTTAQPEPDNPEYMSWKRRKIESAKQNADEHPDDFLTEEEVWQKHNLDY